MKTSISQSSELLISLLSPLVRTVCHWFALTPPSLLIAPSCAEFIIIIFIFSFLLSLWCAVHKPLYNTRHNMTSLEKDWTVTLNRCRPSLSALHAALSLFHFEQLKSVLYYCINTQPTSHSAPALTMKKKKKRKSDILVCIYFPVDGY